MRVAFVIASEVLSGGTIVIFEHAVALRRRGHDVVLVSHEPVQANEVSWFPEVSELSFVSFDQITSERFDIALATWWATAYSLYRIHAEHYAYFVQSIESRFFEEDIPTRYFAEMSFLLDLNVITEASWIRRYLGDTYGRDALVVRNGIRKDCFTTTGACAAERCPDRVRVLVEGPMNVPFKNVRRAIQLCTESSAEEIWLMTPSSEDVAPSAVTRTFRRVPIALTGQIYRSCDVVIKLSLIEGMSAVPLEMFHCGGTAVVYDTTGFDEYIRSGENAVMLSKNDERGVVETINRLSSDRKFLRALKEGAISTASSWPSWNEASLEFERALLHILTLQPQNRVLLEKLSLIHI